MLFDYLETNIQNKLRVLGMFHSQAQIPVPFLKEELSLSLPAINALIRNINADLDGIAVIEKHDAMYHWCSDYPFDIHALIPLLCDDSIILQCLRFLILNTKHQPFSTFIEEEYLTKSSSYRVRHTCEVYLNEIGLNINNNCIAGPEYRIRFLIGLLYSRYGIVCYEDDEISRTIIKKMTLAANPCLDASYIERSGSDYHYFACLMSLTWKRQNRELTPLCSSQFEQLKTLHVYDELQDLAETIAAKTLGIRFSKQDLDYMFLVFCCTTNPLFADHWEMTEKEKVGQIVFSEGNFADLHCRFTKLFGSDVTSSHAFKTTLVTFYKKCILELQCIIPDENCYLYSRRNSITLALYRIILSVLNDWSLANDQRYMIRTEHVFFLSMQTAFILSRYMPPVPVYVCSDRPDELEVMYLYLNRRFSSTGSTIIPLLLNTGDKETLLHIHHAIIIADNRIDNILHGWNIDKDNTIIPISTEMNNIQLQPVRDAIKKQEESTFLSYLDDLAKMTG